MSNNDTDIIVFDDQIEATRDFILIFFGFLFTIYNCGLWWNKFKDAYTESSYIIIGNDEGITVKLLTTKAKVNFTISKKLLKSLHQFIFEYIRVAQFFWNKSISEIESLKKSLSIHIKNMARSIVHNHTYPFVPVRTRSLNAFIGFFLHTMTFFTI